MLTFFSLLSLSNTANAQGSCEVSLQSIENVGVDVTKVSAVLGGGAFSIDLIDLNLPTLHGVSAGANEDVQAFSGDNLNDEFFIKVFRGGIPIVDVNYSVILAGWPGGDESVLNGAEEELIAAMYEAMAYHDTDEADLVGLAVIGWVEEVCAQ